MIRKKFAHQVFTVAKTNAVAWLSFASWRNSQNMKWRQKCRMNAKSVSTGRKANVFWNVTKMMCLSDTTTKRSNQQNSNSMFVSTAWFVNHKVCYKCVWPYNHSHHMYYKYIPSTLGPAIRYGFFTIVLLFAYWCVLCRMPTVLLMPARASTERSFSIHLLFINILDVIVTSMHSHNQRCMRMEMWHSLWLLHNYLTHAFIQ